MLHPNFRNINQVFSFNYKPLNQYGIINDTGVFYGIQYYNEMLLQAGPNENVQIEMLLQKDPDMFTFRKGWGFPRKVSFNGDECVMPSPDRYPRLPNRGGGFRIRLSSQRRLFRTIIISLVFIAVVPPIFFHFQLKRLHQIQGRKCGWMKDPPLVCAHGGDSTNAFPNTMDAYCIALHSKVDCTEINVSRSSNGVLFALHDRDPKDVFVSIWHFYNRNVTRVLESELGSELGITREKDVLEEDVLESFCQGLLSCGPFWDHILGYWRVSLESPERILFIKYEDLTNETVYWVKKLAQFIGYPFSLEEEDQGMVQKIIDLCSFENMSNLEVNKNGVVTVEIGIKKDEVNTYELKNNMYFRKGKVGDWKNHLTPAMAIRIDQITEKKLSSYGLTWNV
nr:flavonol 3-sulfotransferase [Quercus suber]